MSQNIGLVGIGFGLNLALNMSDNSINVKYITSQKRRLIL